jgi:riboflavin biosynthesis pyrimidine reductase
MKRPYVICHMVPSIDGRIVTGRWELQRTISSEYESTAALLEGDAWIIGRISMEPYAGTAAIPHRKGGETIERVDFIVNRDARSYAIALDPSGKLRWESNAIDDEHVVTVLSEGVSDDYLAFLQGKGVSYLFGGATELDLEMVLEKLAKYFGIKRLLLEGGGRINGTFLAADLIDEVSVLMAPIADGASGTPSLFDADDSTPARHLKLVSIEQRKGDLVWLRYKVKHSETK